MIGRCSPDYTAIPPIYLLHPRLAMLPDGLLMRSGHGHRPTEAMQALQNHEYPLAVHLDVWTVRNVSRSPGNCDYAHQDAELNEPTGECWGLETNSAHDFRIDVALPDDFPPWVVRHNEVRQFGPSVETLRHRVANLNDGVAGPYLDDIHIEVVPLYARAFMQVNFINCEATQVPGDPYRWTVRRFLHHPIIEVTIVNTGLEAWRLSGPSFCHRPEHLALAGGTVQPAGDVLPSSA